MAGADAPEPYTPPSEWSETIALLGEADTPRIIVSLSLGRASYKPTIDIRPSVTRLTPKGGTVEQVYFEASPFPPGDALDFAGSLYAAACRAFLDARRVDGAGPIRQARVKLEVFDGPRRIAEHGSMLSREAFGDDEIFAGQTSASDRVVSEVLRLLGEHSREMSRQFVLLSKTVGEQAQGERASVLEYVKGALGLVKEAGELHSAAMAEFTQASQGGIWSTDAGQLLLTQIAANVGEFGTLAKDLLRARAMAAHARDVEAKKAKAAKAAKDAEPENAKVSP